MTLPKIRNRRTPLIHILESRARAVFGMLNFHSIPEGIRMAQENLWVSQVGTHSSSNMHGRFFHRGARNCVEDAVSRECGAECFPIP